MRVVRVVSCGVAAILLAACGIQPVEQDQPIILAAGQGLAAVEFDAADPISVVQLESDNGAKLTVPSVPVGVNLYIFQVPAGSYCFSRFQFGRWSFYAKDKQEEMGCFQVKAGELGHSGILAPRVINGEVSVHQDMDMPAFRVLMGERYPIIAKQFLPPEVKEYTAADLSAPAATSEPPVSATEPTPVNITPRQAPPVGTDQISSWIEYVPGTLADVVFFRNNTGWPMEVRRFELYDCVAVKQKCGVQKFTLILPPHATRQAMIIEPADPHDAYTYQTRYIYGFIQNGKH